MLYVTTRNSVDTYTCAHTLQENRGPDGGFYVPMRLPVLTSGQIAALGEKSFSQNVADTVNLFFGTKLDSWSVEFAIGRYPVQYKNAGNRTLVAETWHNPAWNFERLARGIEKAIRQSDQISPEPADWLVQASRIAVMFGIFGELIRGGVVSSDAPVDVVVPAGDFSAPMSCWYARQMGLPIHNIICCCNENAAAWNLIHKGELRTDAAVIRTDTPACDYAVPEGLERLISVTLGTSEACRFAVVCARGGNYYLEPHQLAQLRKHLYAAVVSTRQMESAVSSVYGSYGYLADPCSALCIAGIGNYRSKTGESRRAVVISEESPTHHLGVLARCLGTTPASLKQALD